MGSEDAVDIDAAGTLFNWSVDKLVRTVAGTIGGKVGGDLSGWIISTLLGGETASEDKTLGDAVSLLEGIKSSLLELQDALSVLEAELRAELTKVKWDVLNTAAVPILDTTDHRFAELLRVASLPQGQQEGRRAQLNQLVAEIHSDASHGKQLHDFIVGNDVGQGLLGLYTEALLQKYLSGPDHDAPLEALSSYFVTLLICQLKGVHLRVEAFHALGDHQGAREELDAFNHWIETQADMFLGLNERLVASFYVEHTRLRALNDWTFAPIASKEMNLLCSGGAMAGMSKPRCRDLAGSHLARADRLADQATGGKGALTARVFQNTDRVLTLTFENLFTLESVKVAGRAHATGVPTHPGRDTGTGIPEELPVGCAFAVRYKLPDIRAGVYRLKAPAQPVPRSESLFGWGCGSQCGGLTSVTFRVIAAEVPGSNIPAYPYGYLAGFVV